MTELLKELEAMVCRIAGDAAEVRRTGGDPERERHTHRSAVNFIRTHHAEIAEALKDAKRWRIVRELDGGAIYHALGDCDGIHHELADAAIDAHNSAREAGE